MIINSFELILNSDPQIKNETTPPTTPPTNYSKLYVLKENIGGNDANTELLIHSDGANGSTTFTDSSSNSFTVTNIGSTKHVADVGKFGKTGINFIRGLGQALSIPSHANLAFGSGDFTIDFIIDSVAGLGIPLDLGVGTGSRIVIFNNIKNGYKLLNGAGAIFELGNLAGNKHVAIIRNNGVMTVYINGVSLGSADDATNYPANVYYFGKNNPTDGDGGINYFLGSMDEIRISVGVARWTTDFEPPTAPYDTNVFKLCLKDENGDVVKFN